MYRHQLCDSNCLRTQVFGTKRDFQISIAAILKWPKIGSPSDFYLMASTFEEFFTPKNICIDINFVTLTVLEVLWHKT